MLAHCTPWPAALAETYRRKGYWQGESLASMLAARAATHPERMAVICARQRWTYRQLWAEVEHLARGFAGLGISTGDRVVVQLPNCAEFLSVVFALFRLGALPVFALPAHRRLEISYFCQHTEAVAYVIADRHEGFDYRQLAREVQVTSPTLRHVLVMGEPGELRALADLPAGPAMLPAQPPAAEVAFLQLSGGSTGTPKLIPRTHDDYLYSVRESAHICGLDADSVYLCVLPAAHNFALSSPGSFGILHAGGCVVMCPHPTPDQALPLIAREKVSITALVPPLVPVWLDAIRAQRTDLGRLALIQVGGACFTPALAQRLTRETGIRLQQVFGMAEGLVNYTRLDDAEALVHFTQGRPISEDDEIRIVDDEDLPVADGETGHLLTRGPYTIRGYYRADEHNARAFTADGFYRTGDLVRRTPEGYLVVEGRAKDQINRGGEKIAAEEVEHQLRAHEAVADCAIVALPDPHLGERSCAFVVAQRADLRGIELLRFLRERGLASYKIPDRIEFIAQLPKTGVGKINKKLLRQEAIARLATLTA